MIEHTNTPKLYHFYHQPPIDITSHYFVQVIVPTEIVQTDMHPRIPVIARAYHTDLYAYREYLEDHYDVFKIYSRKELQEKIGKRQIYDTEAVDVYLLEWFSNWGDDGHTAYHLEGFVFIMKSDFCDDLYTNWKKISRIQDKLGDDYAKGAY